MPKLSIVTVVKNDLEKLRLTISSIISQDYNDYELIIKDGGSNAENLDFYKNLSNRDNIFVYYDKDNGIYDAMNQAVCRSSGRYILFINAGDTFCSSSTLKYAMNEISDSDTVHIFSWIYGDLECRPKADMVHLFGRSPCHQAIIYSRKAVDKQPFDTRFRYCADFFHLLQMSANKVPIILHEMLIVKYDITGVSSQPKNQKKIWQERALCCMKSDLSWFLKYTMFSYNFIRYLIKK